MAKVFDALSVSSGLICISAMIVTLASGMWRWWHVCWITMSNPASHLSAWLHPWCENHYQWKCMETGIFCD